MKQILLSFIVVISLTACGDSSTEAKLVSVDRNVTKNIVPKAKESKPKPFNPTLEKEKAKKESELLAKTYIIFKDGAKIAPDGKPMLIVFGQNSDPYTTKFQEDVTSNNKLAKSIRDNLTPIYINASENKVHKFMHNNELMDVDTKTLVSIYGVHSTPTLIFIDESGKSIFAVPGYMPPKQFLATIDFVKEKKYLGKDRKKGEVYEALREYYISHGIEVKKAKK